jgi:FkbM family methyltransferase
MIRHKNFYNNYYMKKIIKSTVLKFIQKFAFVLSKSNIGRHLFQLLAETAMNQTRIVTHRDVQMSFAIPNRLNNYRVDTFSIKEPDTLEWIDTIPSESVIWDVGANIGLYSIYAAKSRNCTVFAFEPSVFNLELLARNVFVNSLQQKITLVPIALSDTLGIKPFLMSSTTWGGALSTFGVDFDQHGCTIQEEFRYQTIGVSMEDAVHLLGIPPPRFLKIDVDGIEHFILRGGIDVLNQVESVLVEINDAFPEQQESSSRVLIEAGLVLHKKFYLGVGSHFNQWWVRS